MSKDAQLAMPDRLVQMAGLNRALADPAAGAGAPQALELRHLRYFVALADAGSFTRAAEKIFIAQPTLSQQIRRLEEIVGTPLLQRRREGLRLTPAGRVLLDGSRNVLALADQAVSRTRQAAGLGRPRLRVVIPPGLPESLAVPATASLEELAALQVIHGPRGAQPGTYDAWVTAMQAVDPRFAFSDPPFRHSLAITLALAAAGNRPAAVLTGPAIPARGQATPLRRSRLAGTCGTVRVILQHHPLTAAAALVWNDDLARQLQQMLFDTAGSLTEPTHPQPADLISLTTA